MVKFALAMKAVAGGSDGVTLTVPVSDTSYKGSSVKWDTAKAKALFQALKEDKTSGLKSS